MKDILHCDYCRREFKPVREDQRFCKELCRTSAWKRTNGRAAKKRRLRAGATLLASRVAGSVSNGHFSSIKTVACKGHVGPDFYYFVEARDVPSKARGGKSKKMRSKGWIPMPPGPPAPLSDVEIAALGGYVVTVKPKRYEPRVLPLAEGRTGPTPGALQGDDYTLEYHDDGYPVMPECLRRAPQKEKLAKAA